jgi:hypothetical protein
VLDKAFLDWLRDVTERRWRDAAVPGPDGLAWQPGTRWRGGMSEAQLEIAESAFEVRFPAAHRRFLATLHTPDPALVGSAYGHRGLSRLEGRHLPDWTGDVLTIVSAMDWPVEGLLRAVEDGRWHPGWGHRPGDARARAVIVRRLAAAGPRLVPVARRRYLAAPRGADDGPVISAYGADVRIVAPNIRAGLLLELGLDDPEPGGPPSVAPIAFWQDIVDGLAWAPEAIARTR